MAVPTPRTWVAAELETAAIFNGDQRDTDNFLLAPPRAFAYRSAALSLGTSGVFAVVGLDGEVYDPYATPIHDTATNNSRMVAPEVGLYVVNIKIRFASNATGNRFMELRKGAAGVAGAGTLLTTQAVSPVSGNSTTINETVEVQLNSGDYVELFGRQDSGASLALTVGSDSTFLQMRWTAKQ